MSFDESRDYKPFRAAVRKLVGRDVIVEGNFPVPVQHPQTGQQTFVYCPDAGKLTEVFDEGFALLREGRVEPALYRFENIRSIQPLSPLTVGVSMPRE